MFPRWLAGEDIILGAAGWTVDPRPLRQKSSDRTCAAGLTLMRGRAGYCSTGVRQLTGDI